jgi:segregation and condensation protein B
MSTESDEQQSPSISISDLPSEEAPAATLPTGDVTRAHLKGLLEALLFISEHPMTVADLAKASRADKKLVRALADELHRDYAQRGVHLEEVAGGLMFRTDAAFAPFLRDVVGKKPVRMTRAQLETLAIIAYRQPITRPEVDEIRGVDSGPVMKMLLDRDLVRILGKKDEPGRPLLYGTTPAFLELFGLKSLRDLPSLREFTELSDDSRRIFDREMEVAAPLGRTSTAQGSLPEVEGLAAASSRPPEIVAEDEALSEPPAETEPSRADAEPAEAAAEDEPPDGDYSPSAGSS